jgi:hypothetical protein
MQPITRTRPSKPVMTVDEACESDRKYFEEHPDENEFIREFVPGEFGARELPEIPPGFRYATCVERWYREGRPVGRYRSLMTVCEGEDLKRLVGA